MLGLRGDGILTLKCMIHLAFGTASNLKAHINVIHLEINRIRGASRLEIGLEINPQRPARSFAFVHGQSSNSERSFNARAELLW